MDTIPHLNIDCQEDYGEWVAGNDGLLVYIHRQPEAAEPIATPMADFLAASYNEGQTDAEGADASLMPLAAWIEAWEYEPDWNFFEDEVIA